MTRLHIVLIGSRRSSSPPQRRRRRRLPATNGRITFMRKDSSRHWQVWVAGPHLESARELTDEPADSGWPVWSPDGMKLAFDSSRTDANPNDATVINDVFTMNPDGSAVAKLTDSVGASADAAWSPDGSLIAFDADRGDPTSKQGVYVMKPDGSDVARVTTRPAGYQADLAPRFAPDGRWLVFTRYRGSGESEKAALYVVRLDGTGLRRLTTFAIHAGDADWSPDGKRIVFEAYPSPIVRRRLGGRCQRARVAESDPQHDRQGRFGGPCVVARRDEDSLPRQPGRSREGQERPRDDEARRHAQAVPIAGERRIAPTRLAGDSLVDLARTPAGTAEVSWKSTAR